MKKDFYQKTGLAIEQIANEVYQLKKGERIPSISDFQQQFNLSRGTVQNALNFLRSEKAIVIQSKGHMGTYIEAIDYTILQKYITSNQISGTMPLPYSKTYEGLATGLALAFLGEETKLNIAYIRGSEERIHMIERGIFDFAVVSRFAAEDMIKADKEIEIVLSFGKHSYLSRHVLLYQSDMDLELRDGLRVGVDYNSFDHVFLTNKIMRNYDAEYFDLPGSQLVHSIREGQIDVAIWNYDEVADKNFEDIRFTELPKENQYPEIGEAVIVCHKDNTLVSSILKRKLDVKNIQSIQQQVKDNELIPRY